MGNGTRIPWDSCPGTQIPEIGTDSLGTGTNIAGTAKSQALGLLGSPKLGLLSHGTDRDIFGPESA